MRVAQCQCGALKAEAAGQAESVVACSCGACQRRSGSAFGVGLYYSRDKVALSGEAREFVRVADSGNPFHSFFCAACGTTLYWYSARDPNRTFNDPQLQRPDRTVFDENKHAWVSFPADMPGFIHGRDSARSR
ncbi:MAG: GFA family protein [Hyphomonadaceae bacterium]